VLAGALPGRRNAATRCVDTMRGLALRDTATRQTVTGARAVDAVHNGTSMIIDTKDIRSARTAKDIIRAGGLINRDFVALRQNFTWVMVVTHYRA
jgi:hypothetical protein